MNRNDFFVWLDNNYTNTDFTERVKEKFDNNKDRFLNPESVTAMDTDLVNSIRDSLKGDGKRFIETGTEFGSFILEFSDLLESGDIEDVFTCEVDEEYYTIAKYRFLQNNHYRNKIKSYLQPSKELLESLKLKDTDVFFLDAHGGGYDNFTDNPLTHELREIANQNTKPTIYIHDFGIELEDGVTDVWCFEHEALDKKYWYRFDFDINTGWKLDLDFIINDIEQIYGKDSYEITYPTINEPMKHPVGWVKISQK